MSYIVEYNPEFSNRYPVLYKKKRRKGRAGFLCFLFVFLAGWALIKSELSRFLIPGDPDVTAEAFSNLVEQIGAGAPVGESLLSFCEDIITSAS